MAQRTLSINTRKTYERNIARFIRWCDDRNIDLTDVTPGTVADYEHDMRRDRPDSKQTRLVALRLFYDHLVELQHVSSNPAQTFGRVPIDRSASRPVLTLEQLGVLWRGTADLQDRVIVALLGICGLRPGELLSARVERLTNRDGGLVLDLPERSGPHEFDHVALPPAVAADVLLLVNHRRSGPLLLGRRERPEPSSKSIRLAVDRSVSVLALPFAVQPLTLSYTLRAIAVERGFSYTSVVRSVSESEPRRLAAWVRRIHMPYQEHASYQLGQLVAQSDDWAQGLFLQAERLVFDRSQVPAAGLVLAAATLERALRSLLMEHESIQRDDPHLKFYADRLRAQQLISTMDRETIVRIAVLRNHAAHGQFDEITSEDALWVLAQSREIAARITTNP